MILPDVNVLVSAFRSDAAKHRVSRDWLTSELRKPSPFGLSTRVLEGFIRIVTHPRIFRTPTKTDHAFKFTRTLLSAPNSTLIDPGERHWGIFEDLAHSIQAAGNDIPDAWLAALAIESGCEWVTWDAGFQRFPDLKWHHPAEDTGPT